MTTTLNRRQLLQILGLAGASTALSGTLAGCRGGTGAGGAGGGAAGNTLSINSFGGTFQEVIESVVVKSFQDKFDATVDVTTAISTEALTKLKASPKGDPAFDVAYMDLAPIYQAKAAGLLQPFDRSKIPSLDDVYPLAVDTDGYWVAELVSMTGIAYNTEHVKNPPRSWQDLWDPQWEGRVAISDVAGTAGYQFLVMAAQLNSGSEANIDPGFAALRRLKPNLASIYRTPDEMSRLLSAGEAWLGPWYADRLSSLKQDGAPVDFVSPDEGAIAILSSMVLPKGSPQADLAHRYIQHQLSPQINEEFVTSIAEGPTNSKVKLSKQFLSENYVPYGPDEIKQLVSVDHQAIAKNLSEWTTRWQSEIAN